jgi:membrane protein implicated in regulation of membrane protease activity
MRRPSERGFGVATVRVMGMVIPACGLGAIAIMLDLPYLLIAAAVVVALAILTAWAIKRARFRRAKRKPRLDR